MRATTSLGLSTLLLAAAATASAQPVGSEFRVNAYTSGTNEYPSIGISKDGSFVVAWEAFNPSLDASATGIVARRFAANGDPLGGEFLVNTTTSGTQAHAALARKPNGDFVVAWESPDAVFASVFARAFDAAGTPIGSQFKVSTYTSDQEIRPTVAYSGDNVVIVWARGLSGDIVAARMFDVAGTPVTPELIVNPTQKSLLNHSQVVPAASGDFLVVWNGALNNIYGRRYDSSGNPLSGEFRLNTANSAFAPIAATNRTGGFVVVWGQTNPQGLFGRRFDAQGAALGGDFRVNTYTTTNQTSPIVGSDAAGNFVVAWQATNVTNNGWDILARRYYADGSSNGDEFRVNSWTSGNQYTAELGNGPSVPSRIAMNANGTFVIVWQERNDGRTSFYAMYGQRFAGGPGGDADGDGSVDVNDVFYLINYLFANGPPPLGPADADGNGVLDVGDVFYLINALFANGPPPH